MHPTEILSLEHRAIETKLDAVESRISAARAGDEFPRAFFDEALDFFRNFADGCHHAKEEQLLFPRLQQRGLLQEGGPIGVMLAEHVQGRLYLAAVRENLDAAERGSAAALRLVHENATAYIGLLRQHIQKEDNILFRMARMVLEPEDVQDLQASFSAVDVPERFLTYAVR